MSISGIDTSLFADNMTDHGNNALIDRQPISGVGNLSVGDHSGSLHYVQPPAATPDYGQMQLQLGVRRLHLYYIPSVYCLTLLGNAIGIGALSDSLLRHLPSTQYLVGILAVEAVNSLTCLHQWVEDNGWETGLYTIGGWCQFATFTKHVAGFLRTWYTVMLATDCHLAHHVPGWGRTLCREWVAQSLLIGAGIVAVVVYLNISMLYGTVAVGPRVICTQLQMFSAVHEHLNHGDVFINALLPGALLALLVVAIGQSYCRRRASSSSLVATVGADRDKDKSCQDDDVDDDDDDEKNGPKSERTRCEAADDRRRWMPSGSVLFTLSFLAVHLAFCLPVEVYRCAAAIRHLAMPNDPGATLEAFLIEQILGFVRWTKCALNLPVLLAAYPLFRMAFCRLPERIRRSIDACRRKCRPKPEQQDILEV